MLYILYLLTVVVLVTADQFSKYLIVSNINESSKIILIKDFFSITYVKNYGAGFSILQNQTIFLLIVTIIAIVVITYLLVKTKNSEPLYRICYVLIIGGAIGNMIDRLTIGYVIDFLDFNLLGYDFPVFNLADCFVTIGCFILIFSTILETINEKH